MSNTRQIIKPEPPKLVYIYHQMEQMNKTRPKIPKGWIMQWNRREKAYFFYNELTGETTWIPPTKSSTNPKELPKNWESIWSEVCNRFFYKDLITGSHTWIKPPLVPKGWIVGWNKKRKLFFYIDEKNEKFTYKQPKIKKPYFLPGDCSSKLELKEENKDPAFDPSVFGLAVALGAGMQPSWNYSSDD